MLKLLWFLSFFLVAGQLTMAQYKSFALFDSTKNIIVSDQKTQHWQSFLAQFTNRGLVHKKITIVHLGDSHIQGGYFTNRVRSLFSDAYGIKERGFVFPYSLAKTNGPEDVHFYSPSAWDGQKYNHSHIKEKAGISGYHLLMKDSVLSLTISLRQEAYAKYPFQELSVFHEDPLVRVVSKNSVSCHLDTIDNNLFVTKIMFNHSSDSVQLKFSGGRAGSHLYGIELRNNQPGIAYHTIGINGASYETFSRSINYLSMLKALQPDCIIISLGTNDGYLKQLDTMQLKRNIRMMVGSIRNNFPSACIILTTPGDYLLHQKYINMNLITVTEEIKALATELNCAYWDFFGVMGGLGASKRWAKHGLMYKDILHLSKDGYKLQGDLFFKAFSKSVATVKPQ